MKSTSTLAWLLLSMSACARTDAPVSRGIGTPSNAATVSKEKIDVELRDVDVVDALQTIAMKAQVNLFIDSDISGTVSLNVRATAWDEVLATFAHAHGLRVEPLTVAAVKRPAFWLSKKTSPPAPVTDFPGEPIEVRFDETPVRAAAKTISELAKVNVVVDDDVQASVTLHSRSPWDLLLYHLAQKYELRIVRTGNDLRITRR